MFIDLILLILGLSLMFWCSEKGVLHIMTLVTILGMSPIAVGSIILAFGTDLPEIFNSILSSAAGHGDINVGDSLGSCLTQISLVFGLLLLIGGTFKVNRDEVIEVGKCELMGIILATLITRTGYITRLDALLLILSYFLLILSVKKYIRKERKVRVVHVDMVRHMFLFLIYMLGVGLGSYLTISSTVKISQEFGVPEFILSFFLLSLGTSLPELVVDLTAIRKKEYELAVGDILGSNIVDSTFAIAIGPLINPVSISANIAFLSGLWVLLVSAIVILSLYYVGEANRKLGLLYIILYFLSYVEIH